MDFLVAHFSEIVFYLLAGLAVAGAVGVITLRHPVHAALALLATFLVVAALFVLRHAEFLAAVQIMVYAGGIMVLFLFVIMLVNVRKIGDEDFLWRQAPSAVMAGVVLGALMAASILVGVLAAGGGNVDALRSVTGADGASTIVGNTEAVGQVLFTTYLVPFEVVSVVLLVAMIGAIIFGRRDAALDGRKGGGRL
jgi:NADH-quinone oxidoreductase subunit J